MDEDEKGRLFFYIAHQSLGLISQYPKNVIAQCYEQTGIRELSEAIMVLMKGLRTFVASKQIVLLRIEWELCTWNYWFIYYIQDTMHTRSTDKLNTDSEFVRCPATVW